MTPAEVTFEAGGVRCSAWYFAGGDQLLTAAGKPIVVMAHGFGGTKDSGLQHFAERISAAGLDVFAFDYRGFGASEGEPRQILSIGRQLADYHAAVAAAAQLPGVDPDRIALWGASFSGSHVLRVAAARSDVAAVIALTPMTSGLAAGLASVQSRDLATALKWTGIGLVSRVRVAIGRAPIYLPLVARPGEPGALALDGAYESYLSIAGPTWRNEICSSVGLAAATIRTSPAAKRLRSRLLVQIADFDRYVPADAAAKTAAYGKAEVRHYPCDHFDVWPGHDWFDSVCEHQIGFLTRIFAPVPAGTAGASGS